MKKLILLILTVLTVFIVCYFIRLPISANMVPENVPVGLLDMTYLLDKDYTNSSDVEQVWEELHTITTLQGVVNKEGPLFYIHYVKEGNIDIDKYWWNKYREEGRWLAEKDTFQLTSVEEAIRHYRNSIKGVVVYDPEIASTSNVASAVCGSENLIAIRYNPSPNSLYSRVVTGGMQLPVKVWLVQPDGSSLFTGKGVIPETTIPSTASLKNDPYIWFIENYMKKGKCSGEYGAYYIDQKWMEKPMATVKNHHTLTNHDFFVSKQAFFFDLSPWGDEPATDEPTQPIGADLETLKLFLSTAYELNKGEKMCYIGGFPSWAFKYTDHPGIGGKHWDVHTEWEFSKLIGAYNAFKDADAIGYGALANASFWRHFPLKDKYPQRRVTNEELIKKGYLTNEGKLDLKGRDLVIFYVGDYDASSWVAQRTPTIWDDPNRGSVPMMWSISPVLEERVPMALDYYRETATSLDYFVSADNGAGYLMPGMLQGPRPISGYPSGWDAWTTHCKRYYNRWDLTITGFVIDGTAPGLTKEGLDCYASFSPDGIVPQKIPLTLLHGEMPVLRSDDDVIADNPLEAAQHVMRRVNDRPIPFHWFRNILKTPTWYKNVAEEMKQLNPQVELVDAPTFFTLYKKYLQENPEAAKGEIK